MCQSMKTSKRTFTRVLFEMLGSVNSKYSFHLFHPWVFLTMQGLAGTVPLLEPLAHFIQNFTWSFSQIVYIQLISKIPYCEFTCSLKFICNPQIQYPALVAVRGHMRSGENFRSPSEHHAEQGNYSDSVSALILYSSVLFVVYLVPYFSHFYAFCW